MINQIQLKLQPPLNLNNLNTPTPSLPFANDGQPCTYHMYRSRSENHKSPEVLNDRETPCDLLVTKALPLLLNLVISRQTGSVKEVLNMREISECAEERIKV